MIEVARETGRHTVPKLDAATRRCPCTVLEIYNGLCDQRELHRQRMTLTRHLFFQPEHVEKAIEIVRDWPKNQYQGSASQKSLRRDPAKDVRRIYARLAAEEYVELSPDSYVRRGFTLNDCLSSTLSNLDD